MSKSINPDELLTVTQAADERGTTRQAINYLVRQGKLATVEIAGRRFVTRKALAEYTPDPGGRPPGTVKATKKGDKVRPTPPKAVGVPFSAKSVKVVK